jgi:hypothetical protein
MNTQNHRKKPQDDIPTDVIIHNIVKDYQRMFLAYNETKARAEKAEATILELKETHYKQLLNRDKEIANRDKEIEKLKKLLESKTAKKNEKLEEKLSEALQQNRRLTHALLTQDRNEDARILFKGMLPADAEDLKEKMGDQLSNAILKLEVIEDSISYIKEQIETNTLPDIDAENMDYFLMKVQRALERIEGAKSNIDNFYKLAKGIPLI